MLKIAPRTLCRLSCHAIERGRESPQRPDNHCSAGKNQQPHLPDGQIRDRHSSGGGGRQHEHAGPGRAILSALQRKVELTAITTTTGTAIVGRCRVHTPRLTTIPKDSTIPARTSARFK